MKQKLDTPWFGIVVGLFGVLVGLLITWFFHTGVSDGSLGIFLTYLAEDSMYRADVLMFSIVPNPVFFFILSRLLKMQRTANGVVIVSLVLAIYIIALNLL